MVRIEPHREDWQEIGADDDGTIVYFDPKVVRDFETSFFTVWVKLIPLEGSQTFVEIKRALESQQKRGTPDYVKQLIEIDLPRGLSRMINLVVCDKHGAILDAISFRFPDWSPIEADSITDRVKENIATKFPEVPTAKGPELSLKFTPPKVRVKLERVEMSKRYQISNAEPGTDSKIRLDEVDI